MENGQLTVYYRCFGADRDGRLDLRELPKGLGRGAVWGTFSAADGVSSSGSGDDLEERVEPVSAADPLLASGLFRQVSKADTGRCLVCVASVGESCPDAERKFHTHFNSCGVEGDGRVGVIVDWAMV